MTSQMNQLKAIKRAIRNKNITQLKALAVKHGFLSDKLRKKAWPLVLGLCDDNDDPRSKNNDNSSTLQATDPMEYRQIEHDIKRTALDYHNTKTNKAKYKSSLSKILHSTFDHNSHLHYVQGFNDVTSILCTVCTNTKLAQKLTQKVAETLMSDYIMNENRSLDIHKPYQLIFDIIERSDQSLNRLLKDGHDFMAISISWLLTWFAHQVNDRNVVCRIYDYCLCSDKFISSYLSAAVLIYLKRDLIASLRQNGMSLFEYFSELKWNEFDFDRIIHISDTLYTKYGHVLGRKYSKNESGESEDEAYSSESMESSPRSSPVCRPSTPWNEHESLDGAFDLEYDIPFSMRENARV